MTETLSPNLPTQISEIPPMDTESFRSHLKDLKESRLELLESSETSDFDPKQLAEDVALGFERIKQIELDETSVGSLEPNDLDVFLEHLRKEIGSTEEENIKISNEIDDLTTTFTQESNSLDADIEMLSSLPNLIDSQGPNVRPFSGDVHDSPIDVYEDSKFEILKLQQQIEICNSNLTILQDLDIVFKRIEAVGQFEDMLSEVKVLEFEGNCIRISMKTHINFSDGLLFRHKLDCLVEPHVVEHELLIEVVDANLELHKVEIFPNDVPLDDILYAVKSSSHMVIHGSHLECLVRQVQHRILLYTLKRSLLRDAKKSRHSFEYSDRDETITAHMVGGIDAFIKIPQSWPMKNSGLKLVSIKNSNFNSKSISVGFLYKIKELANSSNFCTRSNLVQFMDSIEEILVQEMHSEQHS